MTLDIPTREHERRPRRDGAGRYAFERRFELEIHSTRDDVRRNSAFRRSNPSRGRDVPEMKETDERFQRPFVRLMLFFRESEPRAFGRSESRERELCDGYHALIRESPCALSSDDDAFRGDGSEFSDRFGQK